MCSSDLTANVEIFIGELVFVGGCFFFYLVIIIDWWVGLLRYYCNLRAEFLMF